METFQDDLSSAPAVSAAVCTSLYHMFCENRLLWLPDMILKEADCQFIFQETCAFFTVFW